MNTVEKFDQLICAAQDVGYKIRYDYFGGTGGGICQFGGARWLFVDLALSVSERLDFLIAQLREDRRVLDDTLNCIVDETYTRAA